MKLLVVGGGGREHAIIKKLKENPQVETVYALPGNGGIAKDAECFDVSATDVAGVVELAARLMVDLVFVAPDDPLVAGMVDALERKAHLKGNKVSRYKYLGLLLFVGIPLPGTGAWTGALAAAFLDMPLRKAMPSIVLGVILAGCIMTGLTHLGFDLFATVMA